MSDADFYCLHSELCKTLASEKRQMILGALRDGELTVTELQERTAIPQATLSQHLALLRRNDVVTARRTGTRIFYSITNPKIIQAFDLITEVMLETLEKRKHTTDIALGADGIEGGLDPATQG